MERKICIKCGKSKLIRDFRKDKYCNCNVCKECHNKRRRELKNLDPEFFRKRQSKQEAKRRRKNYLTAYQYLEVNPCERCGESNAVLLDFYFPTKSILLSNSARKLSRESFVQTLHRARVLCVKCVYLEKLQDKKSKHWKSIAMKELL